jgi:hypothetical protein
MVVVVDLHLLAALQGGVVAINNTKNIMIKMAAFMFLFVAKRRAVMFLSSLIVLATTIMPPGLLADALSPGSLSAHERAYRTVITEACGVDDPAGREGRPCPDDGLPSRPAGSPG